MRWIIGLLLVSAVAIGILLGRHDDVTPSASDDHNEAEPSAAHPTIQASPAVATATSVPAPTPATASENIIAPATDSVPFEKRLEDLAGCLKLRDIKASEESENLDFFSLNASLSNKFGGIKRQEDLWASTELQTSNGTRRRLFVDFRQAQPSLRYLEVQQDGSQKNLDLSPDQMAEPSESLIASLESDGQILGRARERLISYQYGQKIQVREVDGKVYSFKVTQGAKTFSCGPDGSKNMNCLCTE